MFFCVKRDITTHLSELAAQLRRYFPETDESDSWIRYPFSAVPAALPASEQESLIDVAYTGTDFVENNLRLSQILCILSSTPFSLTCGEYFTVSSVIYRLHMCVCVRVCVCVCVCVYM